jgi:hypothetical protein
MATVRHKQKEKKGIIAGDIATTLRIITYPCIPTLILHKTEPFWASKELEAFNFRDALAVHRASP